MRFPFKTAYLRRSICSSIAAVALLAPGLSTQQLAIAGRLVPAAIRLQSGLVATADAAWEAKRYPEAAAAYKEVLALEPANQRAAYRLGWSYNELDQYGDAVGVLKEAARLNPGDAEALIELGYAYRNLDRYSDATAAYKNATTLDPENAPAHYELGLLYLTLKDRASAKAEYRVLAPLDQVRGKKLLDAIGTEAADWIRYTSREGRYSVLVPLEPTASTQETQAENGAKVTQYLATALDSDAAVVAGYFDVLPDMTFSLDKARDGYVKAVKGTLISETAISLGGSPGRDIRVSAALDGAEILMRTRFYEIDRRIFMLQFLIPKSAENSAYKEKAERYFDSFQVTKTR